jgi:tetratricopeptide (TPR) repeat protein
MPDVKSRIDQLHSDKPRSAPSRLLIGTLVIALFVVMASVWSWQRSAKALILPAVVSLKEAEIARKSFEKQYGRAATHEDVVSWMAEWYLSRKRPADAIVCFNEIPTSHPEYGRMARFQQGRELLSLNRAIEAEQQFRELIPLEEASPTLDPKYLLDARQRLRHILEVELRFEERHELLKGVIAREEGDNFETVAACFSSQLRWNGPKAVAWLEEFRAVDPEHPVLRTAHGRYLTGQGKLQEAREVLEQLVTEFPENLRAKAALIACLREADAPDEVARRIAELPPQAPDEPWLLLLQRGAYALQNGRGAIALAAYEQVVQQDRTSAQAWQGIAQATRLTGDKERRAKAITMAGGLGRIQNHIGKGIQRATDSNSFIDVADVCAEIGLDREGWIMTQFARKLAPRNKRVLAAVKLFEGRMSQANPKPPTDK